ncbi:unnamed protein product [Caretta caretta]
MKLQIVAAILLVTILSPKRSSAQQVGAQGSLGVGASLDVPDVETPVEEAVSVFPQRPAGVGFPRENMLYQQKHTSVLVELYWQSVPSVERADFSKTSPCRLSSGFNGAMICGLRIMNY